MMVAPVLHGLVPKMMHQVVAPRRGHLHILRSRQFELVFESVQAFIQVVQLVTRVKIRLGIQSGTFQQASDFGFLGRDLGLLLGKLDPRVRQRKVTLETLVMHGQQGSALRLHTTQVSTSRHNFTTISASFSSSLEFSQGRGEGRNAVLTSLGCSRRACVDKLLQVVALTFELLEILLAGFSLALCLVHRRDGLGKLSAVGRLGVSLQKMVEQVKKVFVELSHDSVTHGCQTMKLLGVEFALLNAKERVHVDKGLHDRVTLAGPRVLGMAAVLAAEMPTPAIVLDIKELFDGLLVVLRQPSDTVARRLVRHSLERHLVVRVTPILGALVVAPHNGPHDNRHRQTALAVTQNSSLAVRELKQHQLPLKGVTSVASVSQASLLQFHRRQENMEGAIEREEVSEIRLAQTLLRVGPRIHPFKLERLETVFVNVSPRNFLGVRLQALKDFVHKLEHVRLHEAVDNHLDGGLQVNVALRQKQHDDLVHELLQVGTQLSLVVRESALGIRAHAHQHHPGAILGVFLRVHRVNRTTRHVGTKLNQKSLVRGHKVHQRRTIVRLQKCGNRRNVVQDIVVLLRLALRDLRQHPFAGLTVVLVLELSTMLLDRDAFVLDATQVTHSHFRGERLGGLLLNASLQLFFLLLLDLSVTRRNQGTGGRKFASSDCQFSSSHHVVLFLVVPIEAESTTRVLDAVIVLGSNEAQLTVLDGEAQLQALDGEARLQVLDGEAQLQALGGERHGSVRPNTDLVRHRLVLRRQVKRDLVETRDLVAIQAKQRSLAHLSCRLSMNGPGAVARPRSACATSEIVVAKVSRVVVYLPVGGAVPKAPGHVNALEPVGNRHKAVGGRSRPYAEHMGCGLEGRSVAKRLLREKRGSRHNGLGVVDLRVHDERKG